LVSVVERLHSPRRMGNNLSGTPPIENINSVYTQPATNKV